MIFFSLGCTCIANGVSFSTNVISQSKFYKWLVNTLMISHKNCKLMNIYVRVLSKIKCESKNCYDYCLNSTFKFPKYLKATSHSRSLSRSVSLYPCTLAIAFTTNFVALMTLRKDHLTGIKKITTNIGLCGNIFDSSSYQFHFESFIKKSNTWSSKDGSLCFEMTTTAVTINSAVLSSSKRPQITKCKHMKQSGQILRKTYRSLLPKGNSQNNKEEIEPLQ